MDHVIWRRENADTKYLRDAPATPVVAADAAARAA
jgi:hypothetical protein